jgi:general secretion pathway protein C
MRLRLDARTRRLMRGWPVAYSAAELALMAGLAIQSARLVWALVTPLGPLGDWRPADIAVPGSPAALLASFDPFFRISGQQTGPAAVTPLNVKLYGVRVDEASGRGSAIVAGPDGVQQSVAVGDEVAPGVKLVAVADDHVTLDRGGRTEALYLDQSGTPPGPPALGVVPPPAPGAPPGPPAPRAGPPTLAQLRSAIVATPRLDGGRLTGLVLAPQGPAFNAAGLEQGDVVLAINCRPVTGLGDLERAATDLRGGGTLQLTVERGGQPTSLAIPVAPTP